MVDIYSHRVCIEKKITLLFDWNMNIFSSFGASDLKEILLENSKRFCHIFFTSDSWYMYLYYSAAPFSPHYLTAVAHTQHSIVFLLFR